LVGQGVGGGLLACQQLRVVGEWLIPFGGGHPIQTA
jgi:hypothetical protein